MSKKILYFFFLFMLVFNLHSSDFEITASVDATKIGIDDVLIYTIKIKGNNNPNVPDIPQNKNFKITQSQRGSEFSMINGLSSYYTNFTFYLSPKQIGMLKLAPVSYVYNGKTYKTKGFNIEVVKGRIKASNSNRRMGNRGLRSLFDDSFEDAFNSPFRRRTQPKQEIDVFLKTNISKQEVNKGEQILFTIYLYSRNRLTNVNLISDQSFPGFFQEWKPLDRQIDSSNKEYNGKIYQVYKIREVALFPTKIGELTIPSLKFAVNLYDPYAFAFSNSKKIFLTTKEVKIQSTNFKGQFGLTVGSYTMNLSVPKKKIDINEILTVKLKIEGIGNIKTVPIPEFEPNPFFKVFEPVIKREFHFSKRGVEGSISSEMTLNFKKKGAILLPSLKLKVYDPYKKKIIVLKTQPVHIIVSGVKEKNESPIPLPKEIIKVKSDISYIKEGKINQNTTNYDSKLFYILILLPFILNLIYILKIYVFDKYIKNSSTLKKRKYFSFIQKSLNEVKEYSEINSIIEEYFKNRSGVELSELTNMTIEKFLVNLQISDFDIKLISRIKTESDLAKFSPQKIDKGKMVSDIRNLITVFKKIESKV